MAPFHAHPWECGGAAACRSVASRRYDAVVHAVYKFIACDMDGRPPAVCVVPCSDAVLSTRVGDAYGGNKYHLDIKTSSEVQLEILVWPPPRDYLRLGLLSA